MTDIIMVTLHETRPGGERLPSAPGAGYSHTCQTRLLMPGHEEDIPRAYRYTASETTLSDDTDEPRAGAAATVHQEGHEQLEDAFCIFPSQQVLEAGRATGAPSCSPDTGRPRHTILHQKSSQVLARGSATCQVKMAQTNSSGRLPPAKPYDKF